MRTLYYEFGGENNNDNRGDNFNDGLFNNYESLNSLDDLNELEFFPIINFSRNDRKEYVSKIIQYLDDYDDYVHNNCVKLLSIVNLIAMKNDEHKKAIDTAERNYQLDIARAADNNEEVQIKIRL